MPGLNAERLKLDEPKGLRLVKDVDPTLPMITGDRDRLIQPHPPVIDSVEHGHRHPQLGHALLREVAIS